jgi:hypothetical protein
MPAPVQCSTAHSKRAGAVATLGCVNVALIGVVAHVRFPSSQEGGWMPVLTTCINGSGLRITTFAAI